MSKVLVIDGNNLLYRVYYKFSSMRAMDGTPTGISYGFPMVLQSLIVKFKPSQVVVVFDGGNAKKRLEILPEYKLREKKEGFDKEDFMRQWEVVKRFLEILCVPYIQIRYHEADDLIWLVARGLKRRNRVIIVSSDKDFVQLLGKNVEIWNPSKKVLITTKNAKVVMGYESYQCVDYLTLDGDKSDNIPGYPGVGPVTAKAFLEEHNSITDFLKSGAEKFKKIEPEPLEAVYRVNRAIIDIKYFCRKYITYKDFKSARVLINDTIDTETLAYICADNSIKTFIKKPFIKAFKNLL